MVDGLHKTLDVVISYAGDVKMKQKDTYKKYINTTLCKQIGMLMLTIPLLIMSDLSSQYQDQGRAVNMTQDMRSASPCSRGPSFHPIDNPPSLTSFKHVKYLYKIV